MPAYNFKPRFVEPVRAGIKRTTIRPYRSRRPTRAGDLLYLYTGQRTKHCELIGLYRCIRVTPIVIQPEQRAVILDGRELAGGEIEPLAQGDGFQDVLQFFEFFRKVYGDQAPRMELITWEPLNPPSIQIEETWTSHTSSS